jgi:hypothetical protein
MRTSQHFAQKKLEAIEHLHAQTFVNRQARRDAFFQLMDNLITDFKGEKGVRDITRRDQRVFKDVQVVVFADRSYARQPRIEELDTFVPKAVPEEAGVFTQEELDETRELIAVATQNAE